MSRELAHKHVVECLCQMIVSRLDSGYHDRWHQGWSLVVQSITRFNKNESKLQGMHNYGVIKIKIQPG